MFYEIPKNEIGGPKENYMALPKIGILGKFKTSRVSICARTKKNKTSRVQNGLVKIPQNVRQNGKLGSEYVQSRFSIMSRLSPAHK